LLPNVVLGINPNNAKVQTLTSAKTSKGIGASMHYKKKGYNHMGTIVLAISGSLRNKSFTEKMLDLCIEGMGENLEVHKFYPHKMKIGP